MQNTNFKRKMSSKTYNIILENKPDKPAECKEIIKLKKENKQQIYIMPILINQKNVEQTKIKFIS